MPDIESDLLCRIAEGNQVAFASLFHTHRNKLYGFLFHLSGSQQQAEDIVQDVFLKIWANRANLPEVQNFSAYLFRMAHNHCINLLKRTARENAVAAVVRADLIYTGTEEQIQYRETELLVRNAIEHLPAQQKLVYRMSREEGLNQQQISERLHITVPTVKSHMTQALRALRMECKDLDGAIKSAVLLFLCWYLD